MGINSGVALRVKILGDASKGILKRDRLLRLSPGEFGRSGVASGGRGACAVAKVVRGPGADRLGGPSSYFKVCATSSRGTPIRTVEAGRVGGLCVTCAPRDRNGCLRGATSVLNFGTSSVDGMVDSRVSPRSRRASKVGNCDFGAALLTVGNCNKDRNAGMVVFDLTIVVVVVMVLTDIFMVHGDFTVSVARGADVCNVLTSINAAGERVHEGILFRKFVLNLVNVPLKVLLKLNMGTVLVTVLGDILKSILDNTSFMFMAPAVPVVYTVILSTIAVFYSSFFVTLHTSEVPPLITVENGGSVGMGGGGPCHASGLAGGLFNMNNRVTSGDLGHDEGGCHAAIVSVMIDITVFVTISTFVSCKVAFASRCCNGTSCDCVIIKVSSGRTRAVRGVPRVRGCLAINLRCNCISTSIPIGRYNRGFLCSRPSNSGSFNTRFLRFRRSAFIGVYERLRLSCGGIGNNMLICSRMAPGGDRDNGSSGPVGLFNGATPAGFAIRKGSSRKGTLVANGLGISSIFSGVPRSVRCIANSKAALNKDLVVNRRNMVSPRLNRRKYNVALCTGASSRASLAGHVRSVSNANSSRDCVSVFSCRRVMERFGTIVLVIKVFICNFVNIVSLVKLAGVFGAVSAGVRLEDGRFTSLGSVNVAGGRFGHVVHLRDLVCNVGSLLVNVPLNILNMFTVFSTFSGKDIPVDFMFP